MSRFDRLYSRLPVRLQNLAVSAYGIYWHWARFGGKGDEYRREFESREEFKINELSSYQERLIKEYLPHWAKHIPFYRDHWTTEEKKSASRGILSDLPLLEKNTLREDPKRFLRDDLHPFPQFVFQTSGTTGTPIASYYSLQELRQSLALREARSANWAGVSFRMPRATISGRMVEPDPASSGPFYRYNSIEKQVYFSAFHIRPDTAIQYVEALRKHQVEWLTGYAVSYYLLARHILLQGIQVPPLRAIITTSEKVTPQMRKIMEKAFNCRVYEEYSTVENAVFASECPFGRLHLSPDVSLVEILRSDGTPAEPGEIGEIVTTTLMKKYQPLVRFRLGDLGAWDPEPCPCGLSMPVIKEIVGRIEDVVIGSDGRELVRFHGVFVDQPHINEGQIIQETINHIHVKVVPTNGFSDADTADIVARVQQRLGSSVDVTVEKVDTIPRSSAGKFKAVISKVSK